MYTTTSTAYPLQERTTEDPFEYDLFTDDPLQDCQIDGLPSSKEDGKRQLEELVLYAKLEVFKSSTNNLYISVLQKL